MNNKKKYQSPAAAQNYFKDAKAKKAAMYKLWIAWLPQYMSKWGNRKTSVWYSYNKRRDNGLNWLIERAKELRTEFKVAKIYDNQTGEELFNIPGCDIAHLNRENNLDSENQE